MQIAIHTVTGQSPYETVFGRKIRIGCMSREDQEHQLRNSKKDDMREFVDKKKEEIEGVLQCKT